MAIYDFSLPSSGKAVYKYLTGVCFIIALIILSVFWGLHLRSEDQFRRQLIGNGRAFFNEMMMTRLWLTSHQGVYVKQNPGDEVNPYLKSVPGLKTTLKDSDGDIYILKNPDQVTREISVIASQKGIFEFHLTSLKPLNPANAPDDFERRALEAFTRGAKEEFRFEDTGRGRLFRYMAPLATEASCLRCHAHQGYKAGEIRGGISVNMPAEDVFAQMRASNIYLAVSALGVLLMMLLTVYLIARYFLRNLNVAEQRLFSMATTDALTGVYNRREGCRLIDIETMRARRIQTSVCAMMLDIDHFRNINDTYGNQTGDDVLAGVAAVIQKILRASDIVCRYGGEEFLILATETNIENAKLLAERLRSSIEKEAILAVQQMQIYITVSIGLAQYQPTESCEYMIFRADQALYQAKNNGRNRVCAG